MLSNRLSVAAATIAASLGCSPEKTSPSLATSTAEMRSMLAPTVTPQESGAAFRFYAVSPVNAKVVWASAGGGTYALTTDGGKTWKSRQVPGAETLQFRDVEGVSNQVAYLMSAGEGEANRIYKTEDLAQGEVLFAATGVTDGELLRGVRFFAGGARTHSIVMRSKSGTIRHIEATHHFDRKPVY